MTTTNRAPASTPGRAEASTSSRAGGQGASDASWPWRRWQRPPFGGVAGGVALLCLSLTPSLVPRHWLLQGAVSGVSAAIGYGLGVLISHLVRQLVPRWREPAADVKRGTWWALCGVSLVAIATFGVYAGVWQRELHQLMGIEDPPASSYLGTVVVAALLMVALVLLGRGVRLAARWVGEHLRRWLHADLAAVLGAVIVGVLLVGSVEGVVLRATLIVADRSFQAVNEAVAEDVAVPDGPRRSGGPGSHVAWEDLGSQGRAFVAGAVEPEELVAVNGRVAAEPIRVYAGLDSAADLDERAELAVAELERTGAFEREVLVVAGATGRGWVNPVAAAAIEHLHDGDTALVSMQYSYLPSWLSFLADVERAAEAGDELLTHVHARWSQLPADERPRLLVYGESLGSLAMESAFEDLDDLRARTDGALFVGPPNVNPLWRDLVADRDEGSPQQLPVLDDGVAVRFATSAADLGRPAAPWERPRVAYLQHPSDPVVWWSPRLAVQRPAWLAEPRADDVLEQMRWVPFVTFWQLAADLAHADQVPAGHGHDYGTLVMDGWWAVAPPDGWSETELARLRAVLEEVDDAA